MNTFDDVLLEEEYLPKPATRAALRLEEWHSKEGYSRAERRRSSRSSKTEVIFGDESEAIEWIRRDKRREPRYDRSKRA